MAAPEGTVSDSGFQLWRIHKAGRHLCLVASINEAAGSGLSRLGGLLFWHDILLCCIFSTLTQLTGAKTVLTQRYPQVKPSYHAMVVELGSER